MGFSKRALCSLNRPYHGFERHFDGYIRQSVKNFKVFIWGSDVKRSLNASSKKIMNRELKVQGKGLYRPNFRD